MSYYEYWGHLHGEPVGTCNECGALVPDLHADLHTDFHRKST